MRIIRFDKEDIVKLFYTEKVVLKIIEDDFNKSIVDKVISFSDYKDMMFFHIYNPLLWEAPFEVRLMYLYGCMNHNFNQPKKNSYIVFYRYLNEREWKEWYMVQPYRDIL